MYGYIYKTTNVLNGKIYIGKKKGSFTPTYKGSGKYLRNAINKYGIENFNVEVIEYCDNLQIQNEREKYWIAYFEQQGYSMYNISKGGDGGDTYYKLSENDRLLRCNKISKSSHFNNLETSARYKAWNTRRLNGTDKFSNEQLQKMSNSHKGKKQSKQTIEKRVKTRQGYRHTEETKKKISIGNKNKIVSTETRKKMSEQGKKRIGQLNSFFGKHHSEETRKLIGLYSKERFSNLIWINNGVVNKRVVVDELLNYKKQGFKEGRIKWQKRH